MFAGSQGSSGERELRDLRRTNASSSRRSARGHAQPEGCAAFSSFEAALHEMDGRAEMDGHAFAKESVPECRGRVHRR